MALRQILLSRKIEERRKKLEELRAKRKALEERRKGLSEREALLETAVGEVTEETTAEEREALDAQTEEWQQDDAALTAEEGENTEQARQLEGEIAQLESELNEINERVNAALRNTAPPQGQTRQEERTTMNTRKKFFGMTMQERDAFLAREDVKGFLTRVRELGKQERAVTGAELLIPTVVLDLIREQIGENSKLYKHVSVRPVAGKARQIIMGNAPEAVWTEMCGKLNELNLSFNDVEVDGYKVGGIIKICNATLEDSDINLADEIINAFGQMIGIALDKAILYGTGTKMPLGIVTRLTQTEEPTNYPTNARAWADLHTSNVITISAANSTGTKLISELIKAFGNAKGKYSDGKKVFAMNEKTYNTIVAETLTTNMAGAVVSAMQNKTMPVMGGTVELIEDVPDNVIVGGYGKVYLLPERAGTNVARSEHYMFGDDMTAFRGTARYDGLPVIPEAFVAVGINATVVTASAVTFTADTANATTGSGG